MTFELKQSLTVVFDLSRLNQSPSPKRKFNGAQALPPLLNVSVRVVADVALRSVISACLSGSIKQCRRAQRFQRAFL